MNAKYGPEALNAYIDGEMSDHDAAALLQAMEDDAALREQVRELQHMHELVRYSFSHSTVDATPNDRPAHHARATLPRGLVATLLLAMGAVAGWSAQWALSPSRPEFVGQDVLHLATAPPAVATRAILHVSSGDTATIMAALDEAEQLLRSDTNGNRSLQLEIIANSAGLALLRDDVSPARERVLRMQRQYRNLSFLACRRTLERLKLESGIDARLLPGVKIVPSALDRILLRLREGWSYIKA